MMYLHIDNFDVFLSYVNSWRIRQNVSTFFTQILNLSITIFIYFRFLYVNTGSHDKSTLAHIHPHTYTIGAKAEENPFVYFESVAYDKMEINLYTRALSGRG